ncbi:hypothetical protein ACQP25_44945 (plasmid) [Microtetraspora malaysiensis]|uniref:hypothetical protein n=1 Tax=Microtetraspora malaysiensis TaxID=161358 RepID=UPI003D89B31C
MSTLLAVHRPGGRTQRCDARCYDAEESECACVCGGMNHRAGLARAVENTRKYVQEWIAAARKRDADVTRTEIDIEAATDPLF